MFEESQDSGESLREESPDGESQVLSQVTPNENLSPNNPVADEKSNGNVEAPSAEDIVEVLGKRLYEEKCAAPEVLPDLVLRWDEILAKGIPADTLKEVLTKYPPPKNCPRFQPPKLNLVVKAVMTEQVIERDNRIAQRQEKISAALSAIAKVLSTLLRTKEFPMWKSLAENLSDASKILADLQHDEAVIRRSLITANINESMRETLKDSQIGEFLFGSDLEDAVKNTKALQTASKDLKKIPNRTTSKNAKAPQRAQFQKNSSVSTGGAKKQFNTNKSKKQNQRSQQTSTSNRKKEGYSSNQRRRY